MSSPIILHFLKPFHMVGSIFSSVSVCSSITETACLFINQFEVLLSSFCSVATLSEVCVISLSVLVSLDKLPSLSYSFMVVVSFITAQSLTCSVVVVTVVSACVFSPNTETSVCWCFSVLFRLCLLLQPQRSNKRSTRASLNALIVPIRL